MIDPTDIATLLSEYLQTVCGPTQFMGEIDDGNEDATLGLNTLQRAFRGSSSSWARKGDGAVIINFSSSDTKDVTVNIMSGGDKIDEVERDVEDFSDFPAQEAGRWYCGSRRRRREAT
ncbi:hypothetical protein PHYSODRAFT_330218 [Phytophthora sojae]|uniref:Uncharacterized protein n=1 Tax=Phytophthora sojae (strain P6497) TaxID=1094619 RepID=G4Z6H1_PHYSP|nr:hypothetical protein PHYSODRAFT_330218 [Phytophthora sojae]EGZ22419.1 hypothetical protein PHYSODRAFT_330218 [Phytophthora sojae]|eukprot:XP_009525136.1 hypothetical protein PHYSODRAFT_330218 [Phytophthora sojae]